MRGFINTLVLAVECHTGGAAGQSNSLLWVQCCIPPGPTPWRWDAACRLPPAATGRRLHHPRGELSIKGLEHWIELMWAESEIHADAPPAHISAPLMKSTGGFEITGAETSIKTRRLSLNLSLALRKKQPLQEFLFCFFFFSPSPSFSSPLGAWGLRRSRHRS